MRSRVGLILMTLWSARGRDPVTLAAVSNAVLYRPYADIGGA